MHEIFNRRPLQVGKSFAADSAVISFSADGLEQQNQNGAGLLVQNMGFQYTQPVSRIYELGTQLTYYVAGRPQGGGSIGRILGPGPVVVAFYYNYGDVCKAPGNNITVFASALCNPNDANAGGVAIGGAAVLVPGIKWCLTGVVLNSVGMTIAAQDMIMNENLGFMFVALEVCQTSVPAPIWTSSNCCATTSTLTSGTGSF